MGVKAISKLNADATNVPIGTRLTALEEALAQTDEVAIELYEANMTQEEINQQQDEVLLEIYEQMGGV